jgi:hypothetical protein
LDYRLEVLREMVQKFESHWHQDLFVLLNDIFPSEY